MATSLKRHIGLGVLILYGVGDILGAGIYGLVGKAAGEMGNAVWLGFAASTLAAGMTCFSYASLGSRYPKAGGASYVTHRAFGNELLAYVIGLAALGSAMTSMAAASHAFAGYFRTVFGTLPVTLIIVGFCLLIAGVVARGIKESMWMNIVCTLIELSGLLIVLAVGVPYIGKVDYFNAATINNPSGEIGFSLVFSGAVLTFYSFVGFEDIINVAEEVKNPERNLPIGILAAVGIASIIYMGIGIIAVSVIPASQLATSSAPLLDVVEKAASWFPRRAFSVIAVFATANTALLNFLMGSRLVYGMARDGLLPKPLAKVSSKRQTPYVACAVILAILLLLALIGDIASLARATSVLLLLVFVAVNVSLLVLQRRAVEKRGNLEIPAIVPALGALICLAMLASAKLPELKMAGAMLVVILLLYVGLLVHRRSLAK